MRPLKFRAWDRTEQRMYEVADLYFFDDGRTGSCGIRVKGKSTDTIFSPDYELMEFTGLLDDQGREIYEGDILHVDGKFILADWNYADLWEIQKKPNREVLGNIHQNPSILSSPREPLGL
jgi:uncharacterized phage protein (TIGR01671 family)